jgi:hypothetical protein
MLVAMAGLPGVVSKKWMGKPRGIYRATAGISSGSETGNPWTMRFHSTFGFWKLTRRQTERPEARKWLRHCAVCSLIDTFQLDHQHVFDEEIRKVLSGRVALAGDCKRGFGDSPEAAKAEFSQQRPLVDFLEKSGTQGVGDLKDGPQHALGQRIQFIGVHRCSSAAKLKCCTNAKALENNSLAADEHR